MSRAEADSDAKLQAKKEREDTGRQAGGMRRKYAAFVAPKRCAQTELQNTCEAMSAYKRQCLPGSGHRIFLFSTDLLRAGVQQPPAITLGVAQAAAQGRTHLGRTWPTAFRRAGFSSETYAAPLRRSGGQASHFLGAAMGRHHFARPQTTAACRCSTAGGAAVLESVHRVACVRHGGCVSEVGGRDRSSNFEGQVGRSESGLTGRSCRMQLVRLK